MVSRLILLGQRDVLLGQQTSFALRSADVFSIRTTELFYKNARSCTTRGKHFTASTAARTVLSYTVKNG